MSSNVQRGNYYKLKTRDYFKELGYDCELLEKYISKGKFYKKQDLFGSDGLAMNEREVIFWNAKSTEDLKKRKNEIIKNGLEEFSKHRFPYYVDKYIVIWGVGEKNPIIHIVP
jgi:hypothetical protein